MSAPTGKVHICNLALDQLKQEYIQSIDAPETWVAEVCAMHYDQARQEVLRKHPWNFAIKRDTLTKSATAPVFGWQAAYNLPNDFLRLISIGDDSLNSIRNHYQLENNQILGSDLDSVTADTIQIRYVYDLTDITKFDPLFIKCLYLQMAINMAPRFSLTRAMLQELKEELTDVQPWATAVDGQERPPQRIQRSKIIAARRGFGMGDGVAGKFTVFE